MERSFRQLGKLAWDRGHYEEAERLYRQSLEINERSGNQAEMASDIQALGASADGRGHTEEAERLYRQSLEIRESLGDEGGVAACLDRLGFLAPDDEERERLFRQSLEIRERLGDEGGVATCLGRLGMLDQVRGQYEEGERLERQALEIRERLRDEGGVAVCLGRLGTFAQFRGHHEEAERLWRQYSEMKDRLENQGGMASDIQTLGTSAQGRGHREETERLYPPSLEINASTSRARRGVPQDSAWREEGKQVFNLLYDFMSAVTRFAEAVDPPSDRSDAEDPRTAVRAVNPAHDACLAALNDWIGHHASGSRNRGRKDSTRGGFGILNAAFQDAYRGAVLAHLSVLGLAYYGGRLAADGVTDKVTEALRLALDWHVEAMDFARSIIDQAIESSQGKTVKPLGSVSSFAIFSDYRDRVPSAARTAYDELQPYLNELNRHPAAGLDDLNQSAS